MRRAIITFAFVASALLLVTAFAKPIAGIFGYAPALESLAAWGESFGGVNAFMATAAFFAIAYTAFLQHETLVSQ